MPKDKNSGKKLADMMYGNPDRAAFGITPMIGKRREDRQDREAAKSFPVDLARGVLAGAVGMPGDIESLARLPYELITGNESPTFLPTSEDVLKRIPFGTNTPAGQFASGLGTLAGGSANLGAIPRAVKAAPGALKTAARNLSAPRTLNPQAGVIKTPGVWQFNPNEPTPGIIVPGKINNVREAVRNIKGGYGAQRVERAADEIRNLEKMYTEDALKEAFTGDNASAMMTISPADFERYAQELKGRTKADIGPKMAKLAKQGDIDKYTVPMDEYIQHLMRLQGGFNDVPYLNLYKDEVGIPSNPEVRGHEGRHRNRALSEAGESASLVKINPRGDLREGLPRRTQEEYIEALREELERSGRLVLPEADGSYRRPAVDLPEVYAEGGSIHISDNPDVMQLELAAGGLVKGLKGAAKAVKAVKGTQDVLPAAEREENLQKFLGNSRIRERLYHATPKNFKQFKPGGDDPTLSGPAIWLTPDATKQPAAHNIGGGSRGFVEGTNVMPVYAQARSPLMLDDKLSIEWARDVFADGSREFPDLISPKTIEELKSSGYDSIIHADPYGNRGGEQEIIMFEPNKIKSAIGNRGTYDIEDLDITKAEGGAVHMQAGGLAKAAKALKAAKEAPMKASEALGRIEGRPLIITQADRTKVGGGYLGGPGFSGLQLEDPAYRAAEAAWAVKNPGTAKMILGGSKAAGKDPVYAAMLGTPTQHQSNQMVFDKLLGDFKKAAKKGDLDPELRDRINMRLANTVDKEGNPIFPPNVDILDKKFKDLANTFDRRSVTANLIGGMGVGGKKGQIIDYDKIIRETTDPMLLESPTGALGNRLFTLSGGVIERPDLHPAFPTIMQGEDLGVSFSPVARDLIMKDFTEKTMREKGRTPGVFDYTRGYPPSQLITEDILTELQKMGLKKGGAVRKAAGGEITADDLILEERKL